MRDIPAKAIGDKFYTYDCNSIAWELKNSITSLGITLADGDLAQLGKAIAGYSGAGDYYQDSGTANAYILSAVGIKKTPVAYYDGMRVRFVTANNSTAASTINVATLGVKPIIKYYNQVNTTGAQDYVDIGENDIIAGIPIELMYNLALDSFVLVSPYIKRSPVKIVSSNYTIADNEDNIKILFDTTGGTITLPDTIDVANNFTCTIKNVSSGVVIIDAGIGGEVDDQTLYTLDYSGDCVTIQAIDAGNKWKIISSHFPEGASEFKTGDYKHTIRVAADQGWILYGADGTIGSAASGASIRANADCQALFKYLWDNLADAQCPVDTGRGASADADWAADKKLHPPAIADRVLAIRTSQALGSVVGAATHSLSAAENGTHSHGITDAGHAHNISNLGDIHQDGNSVNDAVINTGNKSTDLATTGISINNSGSGTAHNNMQPTTYTNIMMKL